MDLLRVPPPKMVSDPSQPISTHAIWERGNPSSFSYPPVPHSLSSTIYLSLAASLPLHHPFLSLTRPSIALTTPSLYHIVGGRKDLVRRAYWRPSMHDSAWRGEEAPRLRFCEEAADRGQEVWGSIMAMWGGSKMGRGASRRWCARESMWQCFSGIDTTTKVSSYSSLLLFNLPRPLPYCISSWRWVNLA